MATGASRPPSPTAGSSQRRGLVDRRADRRQRDRPADLPAAAGARWPRARAGARPRSSVAAAALAVVPLVLLFLRNSPADAGVRAVRRARRRARSPRRSPAPDPVGAALRVLRRGGPGPDLLAAGRRLRDLRRDHQRPDRHPLHPGRPRPRHARDHRGRPARAGRHLRHRRHDRLRLAHRPLRPALPAGSGTTASAASSLLVLPLLLADAAPGLVVFVVVYGLDWVATVPPTVALCREVFGRDGTVVFGWVFAGAPARRRGRRLGRPARCARRSATTWSRSSPARPSAWSRR